MASPRPVPPPHKPGPDDVPETEIIPDPGPAEPDAPPAPDPTVPPHAGGSAATELNLDPMFRSDPIGYTIPTARNTTRKGDASVLFRFDQFDQLDRFGREKAMLAMDATRTDDEVLIYFDVPGVEPDDLDITVEKNSVTVEASRRWFDTNVRTLTSERAQGSFKREIQLGDHLDTDAISANLDKGVLTLSIPVKEGTKPRSIEVSTEGTSAKELSTSSS